MLVGIDGMAFAVPERFLALDDLADARGQDRAKYHIGLGQDEMAVAAANEDIVTFGARAARRLLTDADRRDIDLVLVGTESSIDESKASAIIIHRLLGIQPFARCADITEACFGATAALHAAVDHITVHPDRAALVIATDIARYGLNTPGEPTQGAGAVAMLIRANPRVLAIEDDAVSYANDVYDFWRPFGERVPRVDGPLSKSSYLSSFSRCWREHEQRSGRTVDDYSAIIFHLPYTKMGFKALRMLCDEHHGDTGGSPPDTPNDGYTLASAQSAERLTSRFHESAAIGRRVGNLYTGSLYLSLISLLLAGSVEPGEHIGLFSYGSGSMGEVFSGTVSSEYSERIHALNDPADQHNGLDTRTQLDIDAYEAIMRANPGTTPADQTTSEPFTFDIDAHGIRHYSPSESSR